MRCFGIKICDHRFDRDRRLPDHGGGCGRLRGGAGRDGVEGQYPLPPDTALGNRRDWETGYVITISARGQFQSEGNLINGFGGEK